MNAGVDEMILIVTPDDVSVRSAERAAQIIEKKKQPRPRLIVNRLNADLIRSGEMMSARTVSQVLDLQLLGIVPEDPAVYRTMLKHDLFVSYDCAARNAILRISSRLQGRVVPFTDFDRRKGSLFRRFFSGTLKEVTPIDDH